MSDADSIYIYDEPKALYRYDASQSDEEWFFHLPIKANKLISQGWLWQKEWAKKKEAIINYVSYVSKSVVVNSDLAGVMSYFMNEDFCKTYFRKLVSIGKLRNKDVYELAQVFTDQLASIMIRLKHAADLLDNEEFTMSIINKIYKNTTLNLDRLQPKAFHPRERDYEGNLLHSRRKLEADLMDDMAYNKLKKTDNYGNPRIGERVQDVLFRGYVLQFKYEHEVDCILQLTELFKQAKLKPIQAVDYFPTFFTARTEHEILLEILDGVFLSRTTVENNLYLLQLMAFVRNLQRIMEMHRPANFAIDFSLSDEGEIVPGPLVFGVEDFERSYKEGMDVAAKYKKMDSRNINKLELGIALRDEAYELNKYFRNSKLSYQVLSEMYDTGTASVQNDMLNAKEQVALVKTDPIRRAQLMPDLH